MDNVVWKYWRNGKGLDVIDPILRDGRESVSEMKRCIHIALLCLEENVAHRPTMASVAVMLSSPTITLQEPSEPAFLNNTALGFSKLHDYISAATLSSSSSKFQTALVKSHKS